MRHNEDVGGYDRKLPFLSILCLLAPLREKNSPPTVVFRFNAERAKEQRGRGMKEMLSLRIILD